MNEDVPILKRRAPDSFSHSRCKTVLTTYAGGRSWDRRSSDCRFRCCNHYQLPCKPMARQLLSGTAYQTPVTDPRFRANGNSSAIPRLPRLDMALSLPALILRANECFTAVHHAVRNNAGPVSPLVESDATVTLISRTGSWVFES